MQKKRLEHQLTRAVSNKTLRDAIARHLSRNLEPIPSKKGFEDSSMGTVNRLTHTMLKKKGLLPDSDEVRFNSLLKQFKKLNTFINVKELIEGLNVLNTELLAIGNLGNSEKDQKSQKGMFEAARHLDIITLQPTKKQQDLSRRLREQTLDKTTRNNRQSSSQYESQLTKLGFDEAFSAYPTDQDDEFSQYYRSLYEGLSNIKQNQPTKNDDDQITPLMRKYLQEYRQRLEAKKKAIQNPNQYIKQFKKKATHLQKQLSSFLKRLIRNAPASGAEEHRVQEKEERKGMDSTSIDCGKPAKSSVSQRHNTRKDEDYSFRIRKVKNGALKKIGSLIDLIESGRTSLKREMEVYDSFIDRVKNSIEEDAHSLNKEIIKMEVGSVKLKKHGLMRRRDI